MISVLIPVYNFDVRQLVGDLHQQLTDLAIPFEIICLDDGSAHHYKLLNREVAGLLHVTYEELPENLGRSRIRNALAERAQFTYLLFMDCDSRVPDKYYIRRYVEHLEPDLLLYGGRSYATTPPDQPKLFFHWYYGTRREQIPSTQRGLRPYHAFMTNNFLIPKNIFQIIRFDEQLTQYGHEDTLFGMELKKRSVRILHLNNPLKHDGLEGVETFLYKTRQGIQNLAKLAKQYPELDTKLLRAYGRLQKWKLAGFIYIIIKLLHPLILINLKSRRPNLAMFDLYKLMCLIEESKQSNRSASE